MLDSLFLLAKNGEVIIEKHWRTVAPRSVCETFWKEVARTMKANKVLVPTFLTTTKHYLVHTVYEDIFFLGVIGAEVAPLMVLEFFDRLASTFRSYFGKISATHIKENFVTVYQLLDEMMDNGYPLNTEPNVLSEMVLKPTILQKMMESMSNNPVSVSSRLPEATISNIPWRKKGVRYAHNEVYFDIIESLDCIVNSSGQVVHSNIWGEISCECKLSGVPDMILELSDPSILEDFSFHPCVRYNRFVKQKQLSFVPPDGQFTLCNYSSSREVSMPLYVKPQISIDEKAEKVRVNVMVGSRYVGVKSIQNITITIPFSKGLSSSNFTANVGKVSFDEISKVCTWTIGKLGPEVSPQLSGSLRPTDKSLDTFSLPIISVNFKLPKETLTGLRISDLKMVNEKYKPFKGMRLMSVAGHFEVRC